MAVLSHLQDISIAQRQHSQPSMLPIAMTSDRPRAPTTISLNLPPSLLPSSLILPLIPLHHLLPPTHTHSHPSCIASTPDTLFNSFLSTLTHSYISIAPSPILCLTPPPISHVSDSMGPLSSTLSPMTFMMRPSVEGPTGILMEDPVSVHTFPRTRPSVPSMAIHRTVFSPVREVLMTL